MVDDCKTDQKQYRVGQWRPGQSGNPNGRPKKPEIEILRNALQKAQEKYGKHFIEHFVEMAYKDNTVGIALAKKLLPDKLENEGSTHQILNIIRHYKDEKK